MNKFEERWHEAATAAGKAAPKPTPEMPLGFATRIAALRREAEAAGPSWISVFERCLFRAAAGVACAVAIAAVGQLGEILQPPSLVPTVENTVVERFLLL